MLCYAVKGFTIKVKPFHNFGIYMTANTLDTCPHGNTLATSTPIKHETIFKLGSRWENAIESRPTTKIVNEVTLVHLKIGYMDRSKINK
jgi:hypothetical protein